jgi:3-oxoadipate enol-lactonase
VPTVDVPAGQVHYLEEGQGPTLVLLHGMGAEAALWAPVVAGLSGRFRTISFDLRGHGTTACNGSISIDAMADDITGAIAKLALPPYHLAGVSLGGAVALRIVSARAKQVQSLVLSSVGVTLGKPFGNGLADEVYAIRETVVYLPSTRFAEQIAENLLIPDSPKDRVDGLAAAVLKVTKRRYFEVVQAFAASDNATATMGVKCPTLILNGALDELVTATAADALSKIIPGSERREIPDAGHHANIDNPQAFATELAGFVGR